LISSLASLQQGYDTGVLAGALLFLKPELRPTPLNIGLLVTSSTLGAILGSSLAPKLNTRGRVPTLRAAAVLTTAASLLCLGAPSTHTIASLIAARFISGTAIGASSATVPLYISEISPPELRGKFATVPQFCISSGILLSYVVSLAICHFLGPNWRLMMGCAVFLPIIQFLSTFSRKLLPESPRFLMQAGREGAARENLEALMPGATGAQIDAELASIRSSSQQQAATTSSASKVTLPSLLANPLARSRLFVCMALQAFQQLAGINAIVYFTPLILSEAGVASLLSKIGVKNAFKASMISTIISYMPKIPALILASRLMDKMGRKAMLLNFIPAMGLALVTLASALKFLAPGNPLRGALGVLSIMLYGIAFSCSLGPIPSILSSELFPSEYRSLGMSTSVSFQWTTNAIVSLMFPVVQAKIGTENILWFFGVMTAVAWGVTSKFVVETKGRTLEEIGKA
jgi:sugar porter (SP) family MFS transporter